MIIRLEVSANLLDPNERWYAYCEDDSGHDLHAIPGPDPLTAMTLLASELSDDVRMAWNERDAAQATARVRDERLMQALDRVVKAGGNLADLSRARDACQELLEAEGWYL